MYISPLVESEEYIFLLHQILDLEGASFAKTATVGDPNLASWLLYILTRRETLLVHMENEEWTREENNFFENLLAILNLDEPKSWEKIAAQVPGKTVEQVQKHYEALVEDLKLIESGSFPLSHYREEKGGIRKEAMGYVEETEGMKKETKVKKNHTRKDDGEGTQVNDHQQRKKGNPWTEDEHRLFLAGLKHYGKGDWRSISRNYIKSRTPTQVASHAQKYFIRCNSSRTKECRRPSIHDITDANGSAPVTHTNSNAAELASNNQICIVGHATQGQAPNIQMAGRRAQVYLSGLMSNQYKYKGMLENLYPPDHHQSMVSGSYQPSSTMDTMGSDYVHGPSIHSPSNHQSTMHVRRPGPSDSSASNHQLRMHKRTER